MNDNKCENCGKIYTNIKYNWCESCQINNFKKKFANWTSRNEKIDDFIQKMQLKINFDSIIVIEWIPYNQFNDTREIGKGDFATVHSAIWTDGPLNYYKDSKKYIRKPNKEVSLKCLY